MTLRKFESQLKKINPKLRLRHRGYGDIIGLYAGNGYILRMTKGEVSINGYRELIVDPDNPSKMAFKKGLIKKRGRKTVINLLRNWGWARHHRHRSMLMYGINYERQGTKTSI